MLGGGRVHRVRARGAGRAPRFPFPFAPCHQTCAWWLEPRNRHYQSVTDVRTNRGLRCHVASVFNSVSFAIEFFFVSRLQQVYACPRRTFICYAASAVRSRGGVAPSSQPDGGRDEKSINSGLGTIRVIRVDCRLEAWQFGESCIAIQPAPCGSWRAWQKNGWVTTLCHIARAKRVDPCPATYITARISTYMKPLPQS